MSSPRGVRRRATTAQEDAWYQLRMAVSCPPSTSIHVRGGWVQQGIFWVAQATLYFPPLTLDFSSPDQFVSGYAGNFENAGWYKPLIVLYDHDYFYALRDGASAPPVRGYGGEPEFETAVEAEQALDAWLTGDDMIYFGHLPLCGVILRNNGVIGLDGQVQAIDAVNRGRSYLWQDLRPRHIVLYTAPG